MDSNPLPPEDALSSAADPLPPKSRGRRLLFGFGCGCAIFLTLLIGAFIWGLNYLLGAGVQVPSDFVLGENTAAFIHVSPAADDEAARELIASLIETLGSLDPDSIDEEDADLKKLVESLQNVNADSAGKLLDFFPQSFTLGLEADPETPGTFDAVGALNLSSGSRLIRFVVNALASEATEHEHGDHTVLRFGADQENAEDLGSDFIAFQHDTLLFSSSLDLITRALDQTDSYDPDSEEDQQPPASPLRPQWEDLSERWFVSAASGGDTPMPPGLLRNFLTAVPARYFEAELGGRDWLDTPMQSLRLGAGLSGPDVTLRIDLLGLNGADIPRLEAGLSQVFTQMTSELAEEDLPLTHELLSGSDSLVIHARLENFREWLNGRLKKLAGT